MTLDELDGMTSDELMDLLERNGPGWVTSRRARGVLTDRVLPPGIVARLTCYDERAKTMKTGGTDDAR